MTPHLHPRSRLTTSLFGTTLLVSFLVVGMPHIIPCPAPRVIFADGDLEITEDGKRRRRRRPAKNPGILHQGTGDETVTLPKTPEEEEEAEEAEREITKRRISHECPVRKPGGIIGEALGFSEGPSKKPPRPRVETTKAVRSKSERD